MDGLHTRVLSSVTWGRTVRLLSVLMLVSLVFGCADDENESVGLEYTSPHGPTSPDYDNGVENVPSFPGTETPPTQPGNNYAQYEENDFEDPLEDAQATFSVDVDTGSYTLMRQHLLYYERLPAPASVRLEEYINFFKFPYEPPSPDAAEPFSLHLESAPSKFGEGLNLLRIGVKGFELSKADRKPANLVFLIDVSGSMQSEKKLGLVKASLNTLLDNLKPTDSVGIVVYAGNDAILLEPTSIDERSRIREAIDGLSAGGSTAGAAGLKTAYQLAEQAFINDGVNRIMLCTDGDFNVGLRGDALLEKIEEQRKRGITISTFGFGMGNYNDYLIEQIANRGNGNYAYIDSHDEAERLFGRDLASILQVIAKDVKVQVDFNPEVVERYRLMGYDNRVLADDEFTDDTIDAAEVGVGHNATALLEFELKPTPKTNTDDTVLADVKLRYKEPNGDVSMEVTHTVMLSDVLDEFADASDSTQFAAAVAEFAEILRISKHSEGARFDDILAIVDATSDANIPDTEEFRELVVEASSLWGAGAYDGWQ